MFFFNMSSLNQLKKNLSLIEERIGKVFANKDLLSLAFVHRSFVNEHRHLIEEHNERLEFLGDSVLGLAIADTIYRRLPDYQEGKLSQLRSFLVDTSSCAKFLQKLHLSEFILLGKGERMSEGNTKASILADVFEALIAAIYLDAGFEEVCSFIRFHFEEDIEFAIGSPPCNYKAKLQDYSQRKYQKPPLYRVIEESGPDHAKCFLVSVSLNERDVGRGEGSSKKEAEQKAALDALQQLGEMEG